MFFLLVILLIISTEITFLSIFLTDNNLLINYIGYIQLIIFTSSFSLLIWFFRNRSQVDNYKKGFYAFGVFIAFGVPVLAYFIPGILYILTENKNFNLIGYVVSGLLFNAILFGIFVGRWNWKIHKIDLEFAHLPETSHELRIVQISDVHVGSFFNNYEKVQGAINRLNALQPDYVFFTGDLVNNKAQEMKGWEHVFSSITAKKGKYSVLGNHDYGDYVKWPTKEAKMNNLDDLISIHQEIGFTPLLNKAVELEKGFWLLGVENWGKAPFRQSGKLQETLENVPNDAFKILLSHDPSHFDEQVIHTDINITLSGHTHGMQFGIERFGIKWSPVSLRYKKWAGLYQTKDQYLYVNRGFGYLGFPGRVGIYPEITLITLRKK